MIKQVAAGVALAMLGCVLAACGAPRAPSAAADLTAIARFNEQYLRAINEGDAAAFSRLTDDGHIIIAPNRPPIVGKAATEAAMSAIFASSRIEESWVPSETMVSGDLAYQRGTFTSVGTPKAGGTARSIRGNFLRIYRRQPDGSWLMTRDMFSSDQPTP